MLLAVEFSDAGRREPCTDVVGSRGFTSNQGPVGSAGSRVFFREWKELPGEAQHFLHRMNAIKCSPTRSVVLIIFTCATHVSLPLPAESTESQQTPAVGLPDNKTENGEDIIRER